MGIDSMTPGPEAPKRYGYSFSDANIEGFFDPEDQNDAEGMEDLRQRILTLPIDAQIQINGVMKDFIDQLTAEEDDEIRQANIFHLFFGSSQTEENWRKNRLHTKDGKFEEYLEGTIEPLVAKFETGNTNG